jgi:hypothetical protein
MKYTRDAGGLVVPPTLASTGSHVHVKKIQRMTIAGDPLPSQLAFAIYFTDRLTYDLTKSKFGTPVPCSRSTFPIIFTHYSPACLPWTVNRSAELVYIPVR